MKKRSKIRQKIVSVVLSLALCVPMTGLFVRENTAEAATDATVKAFEEKISNIKKKKNEVANRLKAAQSNKTKAIDKKKDIDEQLNLATEEIETIKSLIAEYDVQIEEKQGEIEDAQANIDSQYDNFKQMMRLSYEEGDASYLEMVLGAESFYDFLVRVDRITSLMDYCKKLLNSYKENKVALENAEATLEKSRESQVAYKDELDKNVVELDKLQDENEAYMKSLEKDMTSLQSTYSEYIKAEKELDAELEKYLAELAAKENSEYVGGEFNWPVPVANKRISSPYGNRVLNGVKEFHMGIDIPAAKNTPIYASNGGKVITAKFHYSYGNYVVIDHGGGKSTLYAHANSLNVKQGDTVKQGDVIAYVGNTGNSFGCHVHFEVRINGKHTNPLGYVVQPK